jgi:hypothetical protein
MRIYRIPSFFIALVLYNLYLMGFGFSACREERKKGKKMGAREEKTEENGKSQTAEEGRKL